MSEHVSKPIFKKNEFVFPLPALSLRHVNFIRFKVYLVTDKEDTTIDIKGKAKLLGEVKLDLNAHKTSLTNISGSNLKLPLSFKRNEKIVGRFLAQIHMIGGEESDLKENDGTEDTDLTPIDFNTNVLPKNFVQNENKYRLRVTVFSGFGLGTEDKSNSCLVESCLTDKEDQYEQDKVEKGRAVKTSNNTIFNNQFLLDVQGDYTNQYLYIGFANIDTNDYQDQFYLPLNGFKTYLPINIKLSKPVTEEGQTQRVYFLSLVLEELNKDIVNLVIKDLVIDPEMEKELFNMYVIGLSVDNEQHSALSFHDFEISGDISSKISKIMEEAKDKMLFPSTLLKLPVIENEGYYRAIAVYTIPITFLERNLKLMLLIRNIKFNVDKLKFSNFVSHEGLRLVETRTVFPYTDPKYIQYNSYALRLKSEEKEKFEETQYKQFEETNFAVLISFATPFIKLKTKDEIIEQKKIEEIRKEIETQELSKLQMKLLSDNLVSVLALNDDNDKIDILKAEITQKQQLINRFLIEHEEKMEILKSTSNQVNELRKHIEMFQTEEEELAKKLSQERNIENKAIARKELETMDAQELKYKLIYVAQAYNEERTKNEQFVAALQKIQLELKSVNKLQKEHDNLSIEHLKKNKELSIMQNEIVRHRQLIETKKKQEKVIAKLENDLERCIESGEQYKNLVNNIDTIEKENEELRNMLKIEMRKLDNDAVDIPMEGEIEKLEKIRDQLKEDLNQKRPVSRRGVDDDDKKMKLEIQLESLRNRAFALEEELYKNNKDYIDELTTLQNNIKKA